MRPNASSFSAGRGYPRRAGFLISAAWTACTIRNISTRPRRSSLIPFLNAGPRNSSSFIRRRCCRWASRLGFEPNVTHKVLARWEREGKLTAVVTQNIDGLHQKAGSRNVLELHGSVLRNFCVRCHRAYSAEFVKHSKGVPRCDCGGVVKPDVVLYEESLDQDVMERAARAIHEAELLIVAGTSLTVWPAAGMIRYYRGSRLVLINRDETPFDNEADLVLHESLGEVFRAL